MLNSVIIGEGQSVRLIKDKLTTGAGSSWKFIAKDRTYQATVDGTGAVTATVVIEVSNDGTNWITLATISLSGTDTDTDGASSTVPWKFTRANVTAVTGTGATVNVYAAT